MAKVIIPDSDGAQVILASHFEKYGSNVPNHIISGFTVTGSAGTNRSVDVAIGDALINGIYVENDASDTTAHTFGTDDTHYLYVQITYTGIEPISWQYTSNTTGTLPADSMFLAKVVTAAGDVSTVDQNPVLTFNGGIAIATTAQRNNIVYWVPNVIILDTDKRTSYINVSTNEDVVFSSIEPTSSQSQFFKLDTTIGNYTIPTSASSSSDSIGSPTFSDDFSGADNWTKNGTTVAVNTTTDVIDYDVTSDDAGTYDEPAGTGIDVNTNEWELRFKLTIDTLTAGNSNKQMFFGLTELSTFDHTTAQDWIYFKWVAWSGGNAWNVSYGNGVDYEANSDASAFSTGIATGTYYIKLRRTSTTQVKCGIYSDANYLNLTEEEILTIANVTNLRYLKTQSMVVTGGTGVLDGTIDDVEFWNGPTFQDDFSGATDDWTDTGNGAAVNLTTDVIDWACNTNDNEGTYIDMTGSTIDNDDWELRTKVTVNTVGGGNCKLDIYLSDVTSVLKATSRDALGIRFTSSGTAIQALDMDGTALDSESGNTLTTNLTATTFYCKILRESTNTLRIKLFSDSNYSNLLENYSLDLTGKTITNLRYLCITVIEATSGTMAGTIDDFVFYDGGISATASNVKDDNTSTAWISQTQANPSVFIDAGAAKEIVSVALNMDMNNVTTGEIEIYASANTTFDSSEIVRVIKTSDFTDNTWRFISLPRTPVDVRYIQLRHKGSDAVLGVYEIKYLSKTAAEFDREHFHYNNELSSGGNALDSN